MHSVKGGLRSSAAFYYITFLLVCALWALGLWAGVFARADTATLDRFFEIRGARPVRNPIVIIVVDDHAVKLSGGRWPLPRASYAELLKKLNENPPAVVAFDLLFVTPSVYGEEDDERFGEAIRSSRGVVLASTTKETSSNGYVKFEEELPLPQLRRRGSTVGSVDVDFDHDGVQRRMTLRQPKGRSGPPSFAAEIVRIALQRPRSASQGEDRDGQLINFRGGADVFPYFTYGSVMAGTVPSQNWRNKIVLIGADVKGQGDKYFTSYSRVRRMPGVVILANVVDGLLAEDYLRTPHPILTWIVGIVYAAIALGATTLPFFWGALLSLGVLTTTFAGSFIAFSGPGWWFAPAGPCTVLLAGLTLGWSVRYFVRRRNPEFESSR